MDRSKETVSIFNSNQLKKIGAMMLVSSISTLGDSYFHWGSETVLWFTVLCVVLLAVPIGFLFTRNTLTLDSQAITYDMGCKQYRMEWSEIGRIERDDTNHKVLFSTSDENKRLVVGGLNFFAGFEARLAMEAQSRGISIQKTGRAAYLQSRNTEAKIIH